MDQNDQQKAKMEQESRTREASAAYSQRVEAANGGFAKKIADISSKGSFSEALAVEFFDMFPVIAGQYSVADLYAGAKGVYHDIHGMLTLDFPEWVRGKIEELGAAIPGIPGTAGVGISLGSMAEKSLRDILPDKNQGMGQQTGAQTA